MYILLRVTNWKLSSFLYSKLTYVDFKGGLSAQLCWPHHTIFGTSELYRELTTFDCSLGQGKLMNEKNFIEKDKQSLDKALSSAIVYTPEISFRMSKT